MTQAAEPQPKARPLVLILVSLGSVALGFGIATATGLMGPVESDPSAPPPGLFFVIVTLVLAAVVGLFAMFAYGLAYATTCLTFGYDRPVFTGFKRKLYVSNILVTALFDIAFGLVAVAIGVPILTRLGVAESVAMLGSFFGVLVVAQVGSVYVNFWKPVIRLLVRRRLAARGVLDSETENGQVIGLSDPARSSWKKVALVEEDMGVLLVEPARLVYRGDAQDWEATRDQILGIEREVDPGGVAAYVGARNVVLRTLDSSGAERRTRLHPQGWFLWDAPKALDALDARLRAWLARH